MAQGKLIRVIKGEVLDVVVDVRKNSTTFGRHIKEIISEKNKKQLWIPEGFAHGFLTLSDEAEFLYKTTNFYSPEHEKCLRWDDGELSIDWELKNIKPELSEKDLNGLQLKNI